MKNLMNIYDKMNIIDNNYIIAEIYIKKSDINKDIRIINSFENFKRENECEDEEDDYKYEKKKKY